MSLVSSSPVSMSTSTSTCSSQSLNHCVTRPCSSPITTLTWTIEKWPLIQCAVANEIIKSKIATITVQTQNQNAITGTGTGTSTWLIQLQLIGARHGAPVRGDGMKKRIEYFFSIAGDPFDPLFSSSSSVVAAAPAPPGPGPCLVTGSATMIGHFADGSRRQIVFDISADPVQLQPASTCPPKALIKVSELEAAIIADGVTTSTITDITFQLKIQLHLMKPLQTHTAPIIRPPAPSMASAHWRNILYQQQYTDLIIRVPTTAVPLADVSDKKIDPVPHTNPCFEMESTGSHVHLLRVPGEIRVHRAIVCAASSVLITFIVAMEKTEEHVLSLSDDELGMMRLCDYIYTTRCDVDEAKVHVDAQAALSVSTITVPTSSSSTSTSAPLYELEHLPPITQLSELVTLLQLSIKYDVIPLFQQLCYIFNRLIFGPNPQQQLAVWFSPHSHPFYHSLEAFRACPQIQQILAYWETVHHGKVTAF